MFKLMNNRIFILLSPKSLFILTYMGLDAIKPVFGGGGTSVQTDQHLCYLLPRKYNIATRPICGKGVCEPRHKISNNVVGATSKGSDQPAHTHSLIRAFASPLNIL